MIIKIKYLGYSCFYLESYDGGKLIVDPYYDNTGYTLLKTNADIVIVSHLHPSHSCVSAVEGTPALIYGPGYREVGQIKIEGFPSIHDDRQGQKHGVNTIFFWAMRAVKFCHFGDLGVLPDEETLKKIGQIDVAFVPIGGRTTIDLPQVDELIKKLQVKYVIPMKYKTKYNQREKYALADWLKDKKDIIVATNKNEFIIDRKSLATKEKQIVVLEYLEPTVGKGKYLA